MPTVMAGMLEALDLQPGHRVLEIGTGYHAALLCQRVGAHNVVSVELDPALADAARRALAELGLRPRVHVGDGAAGLAAAAPFDRIIATASTDHIPPKVARNASGTPSSPATSPGNSSVSPGSNTSESPPPTTPRCNTCGSTISNSDTDGHCHCDGDG
jgi:protein-L-isoaspartate(D-aspartate) O-methyltransferase (PCMT)